jgi:hypothetical protein
MYSVLPRKAVRTEVNSNVNQERERKKKDRNVYVPWYRVPKTPTQETPSQRKTRNPSPSNIAPLHSPPRKFQRNINNSRRNPQHDQRNANPLAKHPLIQRNSNQQPNQRDEQRDTRNNQRPSNLNLIALILQLAAGVFMLVVVCACDKNVRS